MKSDLDLESRGKELFREARWAVFRKTDHLFARLAVLQFIALVLLAFFVTPYTYIGANHYLHIHLYAALILGALVSAPTIYLAKVAAGRRRTRYAVACCQMLTGALLIHLSGGRIETHFHVFGSLAFLAFYRDWKVFVPATAVVSIDHLVRGIYFPASVFGVLAASNWRWLEHAAWVLFCVYFLVRSVRENQREMLDTAMTQAALEQTAHIVEREVALRTRELKMEQDKFEHAFQFAPIGMALVSPGDGVLTKANNELLDILGKSSDEVMGSSISMFLDGAEESEEFKAMQKCNQAIESESTLRRADGTMAEVLLKANLNSLPGGTAQTSSYVLQVLDITKRAEAERQLRQQEQLMLRSQKLESLGVLAGGIAHELNTPIQFIGDNLNYLDQIFDDFKPILTSLGEPDCKLDELREIAEEIDLDDILDEMPKAIGESIGGVSRVSDIVSSMRNYSHPGKESESVDFNQIVRTAVTVAKNEWKYVADMDLKLEENLTPVLGKRGELMQVILNITINAAHAIQEADASSKGTISIATANRDTGVEIRISDTGVGIPQEKVARVFDPFYTTKPVGVGTGQGLAITSSIVSSHSGRVSVESEKGKGTTFILWFPSVDGCDRAA